MGFLSTVTIYNDRLHEYKKDPEGFAKEIFKGLEEANRLHKRAVRNGLACQPSRHADDHTLYLHYGNMVFNLNAYGKDFKAVVENKPELAEKMLKVAKALLQESTKTLKEKHKNESVCHCDVRLGWSPNCEIHWPKQK